MKTEILIVCHANICRSPMAAALLEQRLRAKGVADLQIRSAGVLRDGDLADPHSVSVMRRRGVDLTTHRSRRFQPSFLADADLLIGMEHAQVRAAVLSAPDSWSRCFTLKELVRRAEAVSPRGPVEPLRGWLERVHLGRERSILLRPNRAEDVADPYGGSSDDFERTAVELESLIDRLTIRGWYWGI